MGKINLTGPSGPPATRFPTEPSAFKPSPQQAAIFLEVAAGKGNFIVEAVAGAGKTTTLVEVCKLIGGNAAFLAFNKKIATDIGSKLVTAGIDERTVKSATFHAMGRAAWVRVAPRVRVEEDKSERLMNELGVPKHLRAFVKQLASLAKQAVYRVAFTPQGRDDWLDMIDYYDVTEKLTAGISSLEQQAAEGIDWTEKLLDLSLDRAEALIDFDDMIWVPLVMDGVQWWQYDWLLVDEAQDTNAGRRLMCQRMLRPGGRLIAVGDRHQAIYGFTGADTNSLDLIADTFEAKYMPLTTTYRCPKAVVRHAHQWVSHIQAADSAPEGTVSSINRNEFEHQYLTEKDNLGEVRICASDAILCRNTKPLVALAFDLIRRKIPCHVEGREIGKGLLALARRWLTARTIGQLEDKLTEYLREETERLRRTGKQAKIGAVEDKVDTLLVLCENLDPGDPLYKLETIVNDLFQDSDGRQRPSVTLSTVHKAKGREWDRVFLLGRDEFMPSKYATQPWQKEQEANLCYVAVTRAKRELIEIRTLPGGEPDHLQFHREQDAEVTQHGKLNVVDYRKSEFQPWYKEISTAQELDRYNRADMERGYQAMHEALEHPERDNFDDQAAAALDEEWRDKETAFRKEALKKEEDAVTRKPMDMYEELFEAKTQLPPAEFAALYENDPLEQPFFQSLTYYCPVQGRHHSVGREDINIQADGDHTWLLVPRCFCGQPHRMQLD